MIYREKCSNFQGLQFVKERNKSQFLQKIEVFSQMRQLKYNKTNASEIFMAKD